MNWLDAMAMVAKLRGVWDKIKRAKKGQGLPYLIRTRIDGRMWRFKGEAEPED